MTISLALRDLTRLPRRREYDAYRTLANQIHARFCRMEDVLNCPCGFRQDVPHHHCQAMVNAENLAAEAWRLHHPLRYRLARLTRSARRLYR